MNGYEQVEIADLKAEIEKLRNQLSTKRPTSFGTYKWACGHEGPSVCKQCWDEKLTEIAQRKDAAESYEAEIVGLHEQVAALESKEVCNAPHDDSVIEGCPYCEIERLQDKYGRLKFELDEEARKARERIAELEAIEKELVQELVKHQDGG